VPLKVSGVTLVAMRVDEIEIHAGEPTRPYRALGEVRAKVGAATVLSKSSTLDDVNAKLREQAVKVGANGVIGVSYKRGPIASSWKGLTATGTAVVLESAAAAAPAPPVGPPAGFYPDPHGSGRLRYWNGQAWTEHLKEAPPT
jgi:hypothetical protein